MPVMGLFTFYLYRLLGGCEDTKGGSEEWKERISFPRSFSPKTSQYSLIH